MRKLYNGGDPNRKGSSYDAWLNKKLDGGSSMELSQFLGMSLLEAKGAYQHMASMLNVQSTNVSENIG